MLYKAFFCSFGSFLASFPFCLKVTHAIYEDVVQRLTLLRQIGSTSICYLNVVVTHTIETNLSIFQKFLMLIREMTFVFHKSKQALTKATLKKLSKTINYTEVSLCSNEQLCGVMVTG